MLPVLAALAKWGLPLVASAVASKGKEVVEQKLGINLDNALGTEDGRIKLKQLEYDHEEFLANLTLEHAKLEVAAEQTAQAAVTDRWKFDMSSDSWLSKNIRPLVLVFLLGAVTLMAFLNGSTSFKPDDGYVELFNQLLLLVFGAYFVGRSAEKSVNVFRGGKK